MITILYAPLIIVANIVYNHNLQGNVMTNIQTEWIQQTVNLLITAHCMLAIILVINPVMQTIEGCFKAPQGKLSFSNFILL